MQALRMSVGADTPARGRKASAAQKQMLMPIEGKTPIEEIRQATAEVSVMNVWVYQGKELKVFASAEAAQRWFGEHDPKRRGLRV